MSFTITHTAAEGTLIEGTARGDGSAEILKSNGWRWGRSISTWYVPRSRDNQPKTYVINKTVKALESAGFTVEVSLDRAHRPAAEVEADADDRTAERIDRLNVRSAMLRTESERRLEAVDGALAAIPSGQPILVGHHSEGAHRKVLERATRDMNAALTADNESKRATAAARAAVNAHAAKYSPLKVANKIRTLETNIRDRERKIDGAGRPAATGTWREALIAEIAQMRDSLTFWMQVRTDQIAEGVLIEYSPDNVNKGDKVKFWGDWHTVTRVNAKSVSVGTFRPIRYVEIEAHEPATS